VGSEGDGYNGLCRGAGGEMTSFATAGEFFGNGNGYETSVFYWGSQVC